MDQDKYISLLYKQLQGKLDIIEQNLLDAWLKEAAVNKVIAQKIKDDWALSEGYEPPVDFNLETEFQALQKRIQSDEQGIAPQEKAPQKIAQVISINKKRQWLSWAAAIALLLSIGTWFLVNQPVSEPLIATTTKSKETKQITLADGTQVWLNKESQLHYPTAFTGQQRKVRLEGEAFFDVQKDASKPFIIETTSSEIKVLGTSFNVRAIKNDAQTEVVVQSGKVQLSSLVNKQSVLLVANEKGIHQHQTNQIRKLAEQDMNELAWKSQVLLFKGTPIPEVLDNLERLFDVTITANTSLLNKCQLTGRFPNPAVDALLKTICKDFDITLKQVNDKEYELIGGNCE